MSVHSVFVIGIDGKPLTPTTPAKAKKLLKGAQAKPVWNKFSKFGIQMLVSTRTQTPKTALGVDFGTKYEGYAVVVGKENNQSIMWKLPDKKKIVDKLTERSQLRRARRHRSCRRRAARFDNREKQGFIAPSQRAIIQSRMKVMQEFIRCYPIDIMAIEDVRFNHATKRWGKNFPTIEVGKKMLYNWVRDQTSLTLCNGYDTSALRKTYGYKKSYIKNAHVFNAHCSDALSLAVDNSYRDHVTPGAFSIVDDTYRYVRRKLHDTQYSKEHIRYPYSQGNFLGIKKGTMCSFGQVCGGTGKRAYIRNQENKRISKSLISTDWLSHHFKTTNGGMGDSSPQQDCGVSSPELL